MSLPLVAPCILLSLGGLGYLAFADPKRRRTFKLAPLARRPGLWPARIAVFAPGVALILASHWSGLAIWAGAVTVLGWILAALPPQRYATGLANMAFGGQRLRASIHSLIQNAAPGPGRSLFKTPPGKFAATAAHLWPRGKRKPEIENLRARITALEVRILQLETEAKPPNTPAEAPPARAELSLQDAP